MAKSSSKNVQIEYKSRVDNTCRIVLQHGKLEILTAGGRNIGKVYSLDFTYPFCPLQAFGYALGLHFYKKNKTK